MTPNLSRALEKAPLAYRLPCADCKFLRETTLTEHRESYVACGWGEALPFWLHLPEPHRWKTRKAVFGPFEANANTFDCPAFDDGAPL